MKKIVLLLLFAGISLSSMFLVNCKKKDTSTSTIVYPIDCAHMLVGAYVGSDYCSVSNPSYPTTITAADSTNITFSNLGGNGSVTAVVNCSKNSITIPTQTFPGGFSISGNGTYTTNRIIINWSGLSYGVPTNCSSTLTR